MVWLGLVAAAMAGTPTKAPLLIEGGGASVRELRASQDLSVVTGVGDKGVVLVDTRTWAGAELTFDGDTAGCSPLAAMAHAADDDVLVFVGCSEGILQTWTWDGAVAAPLSLAEGTAVEVTSVTTGDEPVVAIAATTEGIFVLHGSAQGTTGSRFTLAERKLTRVTDYPDGLLAVAASSYVEGVLRASRKDADGGYIGSAMVVDLGNSRMVRWELGSNAFSSLPTQALPYTLVDLAPFDIGADGALAGGDALLLDDSTDQIRQFTVGSGIGAFQALGAIDSTSTAIWRQATVQDTPLLSAEADDLVVYDLGDLAGGSTLAVAGIGEVADLIEGPSGYVVAGLAGGGLRVLTDRPWIDGISVSPSTAAPGDTVTVRFTSDEPGSYEIFLGGGRQSRTNRVATDSVTADVPVEATFTVPDDANDGATPVWIHVAAQGGTPIGIAQGQFTVDQAPTVVALGPAQVQAGDRRFRVFFNHLPDGGVTEYAIYFSTTAFTASTYATGGPTSSSPTSPKKVVAPVGVTSTVDTWVEGLENGTTYYVGVRASDGTKEGPMSDVQSVTPVATFTPCELYPGECEAKPCSCASGDRPGAWWGLLGLGLLAGVRRRRSGALAALAVATLAIAPAARAEDEVETRRPERSGGIFERDLTPAWATFEFHAGGFQFDAPVYTRSLGSNAPYIKGLLGVQIFRYGEVEVGVGHVFKQGKALTSAGTQTGDTFSSQWLLVDVTAKARVHVIDEQPVVPYAGIGLDWANWWETPLDANGERLPDLANGGSKLGWHWQVGGNFLLDLLAPKRAAMLEAATGINDSWLVVEYRQQYIGAGGSGLDLSGWSLTGGLKIDY
ncbi:MAG: MYXO-CTERM sorting domain-containing protein [Alphaproteobacteria bacterium]|nr:MYXO-CTERM sorting domain-containing protein [Alphaproteobacteria bacterium]